MVTKSSLLQKSLFRYLLVCGIVVAAVAAHYLLDPWGFYWKVSQEETALRMELVQTAETYLGTQEGDDGHQKILDIYNTHEPLAVGYVVQDTDDWCATFVSAVAIQCGLTDITPRNAAASGRSAFSRNWEPGRKTTPPFPFPAISFTTTGMPGDWVTAPAGQIMWALWWGPNGPSSRSSREIRMTLWAIGLF